MNADDASRRDRLEELLALSAVEGLCLPQREELDSLQFAEADFEADSFEQAVAALDVRFALDAPQPQLPAGLLESLTRQGEAFVQAHQQPQAQRPPRATRQQSSAAARALEVSAPVNTTDGASLMPVAEKPGRGGSLWNSLTALAACVMLALFLSWIFWAPDAVAPPLSLAQQAEVLKAQPGTITLPWSEEGVQGEVIWNQEQQEGYMQFDGLAANDPNATQYQLWVFDAMRNEAHPVDGGVFDIGDPSETPGTDGLVTVPIRAKLRVFEPSLFAVTVEKPGGVVVSERTNLAATAPVPQPN